MSAIALAALFCVPVAQVLDRILRAQRHDAHDIEFVHALYSHVVRSSAPAGGATAPPTARASAAIAAAIDALDDAAREQVRLATDRSIDGSPVNAEINRAHDAIAWIRLSAVVGIGASRLRTSSECKGLLDHHHHRRA